jgi:fructose-1,6-bisphosphatase I
LKKLKVGTSLTAWVLNLQSEHPGARGELSRVILHIALAARAIAHEVHLAPLRGMLGEAGTENVHGESQSKLDMLADEVFVDAMATSGVVATLVSEERKEPEHLTKGFAEGDYTIFYDPLDGSSNVDVNITVGSIFSIYRHRPTDRASIDDLLRPGREQTAAGYVLYGPATTLVLCTKDSPVTGFTLHQGVGEFFLSHRDLRMPRSGSTYSVNESRAPYWDEVTRAAIDRFHDADAAGGKRTSRYVGSLIADFHRTLLKGGVFMYPGEVERPDGKLRLNYEAHPLAMVAERAGGMAHDGSVRILDKQAASLHERTPLYIGSPVGVEALRQHLAGTPPKPAAGEVAS